MLELNEKARIANEKKMEALHELYRKHMEAMAQYKAKQAEYTKVYYAKWSDADWVFDDWNKVV